MKTSELFAEVMGILWGDENNAASNEARAVASFIKNHRVNSENAFEVQAIMWDKPVRLRKDADTEHPEDSWHDVVFDDESQVLIVAKNGIGSSLELI